MERVKGVEPSTQTLATFRSTTELHLRNKEASNGKPLFFKKELFNILNNYSSIKNIMKNINIQDLSRKIPIFPLTGAVLSWNPVAIKYF